MAAQTSPTPQALPSQPSCQAWVNPKQPACPRLYLNSTDPRGGSQVLPPPGRDRVVVRHGLLLAVPGKPHPTQDTVWSLPQYPTFPTPWPGHFQTPRPIDRWMPYCELPGLGNFQTCPALPDSSQPNALVLLPDLGHCVVPGGWIGQLRPVGQGQDRHTKPACAPGVAVIYHFPNRDIPTHHQAESHGPVVHLGRPGLPHWTDGRVTFIIYCPQHGLVLDFLQTFPAQVWCFPFPAVVPCEDTDFPGCYGVLLWFGQFFYNSGLVSSSCWRPYLPTPCMPCRCQTYLAASPDRRLPS